MTERKVIQLDIPETSAERVALEDSKKLPKCWGVSRVADNEKAILVSFERPAFEPRTPCVGRSA